MIEYIFEPEIQKMLINFNTISGLRVGIHDADMNILLEYPVKSSEYSQLRFCDRMRCHNQEYTDKCSECDRQGFEHIKVTKKTYIYRCHAGFLEALIPIVAGDEIICALMIGQVNQNGHEIDQLQKIIGNFDSSLLAEPFYSDLCEAYNKMPQISNGCFEAFTYFLEMCAQSIYDNRWISCTEKSIIENFIIYIEKNIYSHINIKQTAAALFVSVSHLSRLIASELDTTFTQYLASRRIEIAKKLLASTNINITELSAYLCFGEPGYFMKMFKKHTGMTCTQFRQNTSKTKGLLG
jgi:Response regulator containing CheY-like receiver domain and AraC-type DNA-binding domain